MSKAKFKTIKRQENKADALQKKFQTTKQVDLINDEEAYSEEDEVEQQESLHQKLTYQYLGQAKLEEALITGLRASISGDVIPKNPWCEISRALGDANLKYEIFNNFEALAKNFKKTPTIQLPNYGIHRIQFTFKEKVKELNDKNEVEETLVEKVFEVFGYEQMLEYVFLPRLKEFYAHIGNILPTFVRNYPTGTLQVVNSLSGGYIIKSELVIYPKAHPKDLDIFCECFVDNADSLDSAVEIFAQFVFEDSVAYLNREDMHIIKDFLIYKFDENTKQNVKYTWKTKNIKVNKQRFMKDIMENVRLKNNIYWKGYCRVNAFEDLDLADQQPFQYIEVYKTYNLHVTINGERKSYSNQPLGSLLKGVFFNESHAEKYASFFYQKNQVYSQSIEFKNFIRSHLLLVLKKWEEQNIGASAWELFYIALYIQSIDQRRDLLESIFQIISSDYSALIQCTKLNNILRMLMEYYEKYPLQQLTHNIFLAYNVYRSQVMTIYGKSSASDLIRFREFMFRLLREMEDNQGGFIISENSLQVLATMVKITKFTGIGNLQRVGVVTHNLAQYIYDSLKQNNLLSENASYLTYGEFQQLKVPKKMMHVSQEVNDYKLLKNQQYKTNADIEDNIVLSFLNEYQIFDNLYYLLRDLFFGKQLPNPLPTAQYKVEIKALQFQLFEISRKEVDAQMCNELQDDLLQDIRDPTKQFYQYITEDMFNLDLKPIYGLKQFMYYTAVFEIAGLKSYLDQFPWQKALKRPLPSNYQVQPILSVSTTYLFHDADVINRTYGEWSLNWDWVIKGPSYAHAQQIFIDTILKYVSWLELATDLIVIGFFSKKSPKECFLTIQEIQAAEDLTQIKQRLLSKYTEGSLVYFKFLFKIETRFKHINYIINMHYIDPTSPQVQNLLAQDIPENYVKVFFAKSEFMLWNKLYPYSDNTALKLITQSQKQLFYLGTLNDTMKLELIKFYMTQPVDQFLTQCRILFSYSESFYNFSKEAESFYYLFYYLSDLEHREVKKLTSGKDLQSYFDEYLRQLESELLAYDNIYFDSIGATILNYTEGAKEGLNGGTDYLTYAKKMLKVADMCQAISDSVVITFRQLFLDIYRYTILWLPKQR